MRQESGKSRSSMSIYMDNTLKVASRSLQNCRLGLHIPRLNSTNPPSLPLSQNCFSKFVASIASLFGSASKASGRAKMEVV